MEHIEKDILVFQNFYKSLKNNGILLISTPSDKGGSDVHNAREESFIDEHVRNGYSIKEITEKLTLAGFRNIEARYTYGKPGNISWRLSMKYPIKMLNASYLFFVLLPFYYLIFFPVSMILNIFDLYLTHKTGTGLLVTARKQE
jgi:SAM-dependent methyltransferase